MENSAPRRIVFFDGVCHLCNGFVDFVISKDTGHVFKFAPLQGETAMTLLDPEITEELSSVLFWDNGRLYRESDAILQIFLRLPKYKYLVALGLMLPKFLRDLIYKLVAKNRYQLFGKRDFCRIPTPEERTHLLP